MGNVCNNSFTFLLSSGKRSLQLTPKFDHPLVWNMARASSSLWMPMRRC